MFARFGPTHFPFSHRTLCPFLLFPHTSYKPQTATHECTGSFRTPGHLSLVSPYFTPTSPPKNSRGVPKSAKSESQSLPPSFLPNITPPSLPPSLPPFLPPTLPPFPLPTVHRHHTSNHHHPPLRHSTLVDINESLRPKPGRVRRGKQPRRRLWAPHMPPLPRDRPPPSPQRRTHCTLLLHGFCQVRSTSLSPITSPLHAHARKKSSLLLPSPPLPHPFSPQHPDTCIDPAWTSGGLCLRGWIRSTSVTCVRRRMSLT